MREGSVLLVYLAVTLTLISQVLPHFSTAIPGGVVAQTDGWQNVWNFWWLRHTLAQDDLSFHTRLLYWPSGVNLLTQTLNVVTALATLPIQIGMGPIAAYNTAVVVGFVLTGYGAYRLAWAVLKQRGIAVVLGAAYTFAPFHLTKLWDGQLEWITLQWIPFALLCLFDTLERQRLRSALLAGVCFALTALTSWYQALYLALGMLGMVLLWLPAELRRGTWRRSVACLAAALGTAGALLVPVLLPALPDFRSSVSWSKSAVAHSADLLDFVLPSQLHPVFGERVTRWHWSVRPGIGGLNITPGVAVLGFFLLGLWGAWRRIWRWACLAVLLCLLALGPQLLVAGWETGVPLPYLLVQALPGAALGRRPNHLIVVALLPLLLVAGAGMAWLRRGRAGRIMLLLLLALLGLEYVVLPPDRIAYTFAPLYRQLRQQPGAIMVLPIDHESAEDLRHQMIHGRPIVGGFVARPPHYPFSDLVPGIAQLWDVQRPIEEHDILGSQPERALRALNYYGVTTLVAHQRRGDPQTRQALEATIRALLPGVTPQRDRSGLVVYQVPASTLTDPFMYLGSGWQQLEHNADHSWRWIGEAATVVLVNPEQAEQRIILQLRALSYEQPRRLTITLDGRVLTSELVTPSLSDLRIEVVLPPGEHQLVLSSTAQPLPDADGRAVSVMVTQISNVTAR